MFCNNCGNELNENTVFCPVCGNRIENNVNETTNAVNTNSDNNGVDTSSNGFARPTSLDDNDSNLNNAQFEDVNYSQNNGQTEAEYSENAQAGYVGDMYSEPVYSKPKSKKKKIILASIASVLVITLVAGFIWWDDISFKFASSDEKFHTIQGDSIESLAGSMSEAVTVVGDVVEVMSAIGGEGEISNDNVLMGMNGASVEVKLGDDIKEALIDKINGSISGAAMSDVAYALDMEALEDVDVDLSVIDSSVIEWIDSIGLDGEVVIDNKAFSIDYGYTINSVDIAKAKCALEYDSGNLYLSAPELLEKSLLVEGLLNELDTESLLVGLDEFSQIMEVIPDEKVISSLVCDYAKCIINAIDGVKETSETVSINGVSQKLSVYSVTIDENDLVNIAKALMKQVRDDKQLHDIIIDVAEFSGENGEEIVDMLVEGIDDGLKMMDSEDIADNMPSVDIELQVYADGREAVGMVIISEDMEISYINVDDGAKVATELMFVTPDGDFGFSGSGKKSGNKIDGEYSINVDGQDIVKFVTSGLNVDKLAQGDLEGTVTISLSDEIKNVSSMFGDFGEFLDYSIVLTGTSEGNSSSSFDISLNNGSNELVVGLKVTTRKDAKKSVEIPAQSDCLTLDMGDDITDELMDIFTPETFIDRLKEAGMPSKYVDLLDELKDYAK